MTKLKAKLTSHSSKIHWNTPFRFVLSISLAVICVAVITLSYITSKKISDFAIEGTETFSHEAADIFTEQATDIAIQRITSQARLKAAEVENQLSNAMAVASTLGETLGWTRESGTKESMSRDGVSLRLKRLLINNPNLASAFTCWEPEMFDMQDQTYAGQTGASPSGRFIANWQRLPDGSIAAATLHDFDSTEITGQGIRKGDFHLLVKETHTPHFITLHPYQFVDGETWLTSAVAPIMVNGRFAGTIGVSFKTDFMRNLMLTLKHELFDGTAEAFIISSKGYVTASTKDTISTGAHMSALGIDWQQYLDTIKSGSSSATLEKDKLIIIIPLELTTHDHTASILISVPASVIDNESLTLRDSLAGEMDLLNRSIKKERDTLIWQQMGIGAVLAVITLLTILLIRHLGKQAGALRESEERLREILLNTSNIVYVKNLVGEITFANPSLEHLLNLPLDDILGVSVNALFPAEIAEEHHLHDTATLRADAPMQWEESLVIQGKRSTFLTTKFPLHDISGKAYGICSIAVDISERTRSEQRIIEMERYLSDIIDSMPSIIIGIDDKGTIRHWNLQATQNFGVTREQAMGQTLASTVPVLISEWPLVEKAIETNTIQTNERIALQTQDTVMQSRIVVYPLQKEGKAEAVIRVDDMTSQARIEEMMIQTEKMLSIGGLAAGMAHEINNPLGAILQGAQNIERRLSPSLPGNIKVANDCGCDLNVIAEYLESRKILLMLRGIRDAGERAARIVHNMLNFSRKSESVRTGNDIPSLVERTIEMARSDYDLKKRYDIKKIDFTTDYANDLPLINCIATEIEQVLLNLFKNAAQAMAINETPQPSIGVSARKENEWVVLTVQDNGPGMSEITRKRIFEPFFTTKAPGLGTGLGLSVTYFIVTENHGGTIVVDSQQNKGTRFTIRLPIEGHAPSSGI